jgi:hypothetical protein
MKATLLPLTVSGLGANARVLLASLGLITWSASAADSAPSAQDTPTPALEKKAEEPSEYRNWYDVSTTTITP